MTGIISKSSTDDGQCDGRFGYQFFLIVFAREDFRFRDDERSSGAQKIGPATQRLTRSGSQQVDFKFDGEDDLLFFDDASGSAARRVVCHRCKHARMNKTVLLQMHGPNLQRRLAPARANIADLDPDLFDKSSPVKYLLYLAAKARILCLQFVTSNKVAAAVLQERSRDDGRRLCA